MTAQHPLRPVLPADVPRLRDVFAQSIDGLTEDDYDEDQRLAWISRAEDMDAFGQRILGNVTLVVERDGELLGFACLKENSVIDMLYVHPHFAGQGVASTLVDALERIAAGRGVETVTVDASETAVEFFETRGFVGLRRNSVSIGDQWLTNTTMSKSLQPKVTGHDRPS
ncbi:MAG: GNAT family N-acetyltransferase [Pseudomonadota bacterium]